MEKIKKFIECLVPVTMCNLKCDYCYVIQENRRKNENATFKYSPEHMAKALSKERLGGTALISICGAGETLIPKEMPKIIKEILNQGHYVNVTTNGTITERFNEILDAPYKQLEKLHFSFSLHYLELKRINKLETFFNNVKKVREAGCSILVQLNLYDGYIPYIEEIKELCMKKIGAYPQVAATRKEDFSNSKKRIFDLHTEKPKEEYIEIGKKMKSPLFDFTIKNFKIKRKEYCYAGDWSFILNLSTGYIKRCYAELEIENIFENIDKPIKLEPIGKRCKSEYCINSSHFMSLGVIPDIKTPSYQELRNRDEAKWYNENTKKFLNTRLYETNKQYNKFEKVNLRLKSLVNVSLRFFIKKVKNKIKCGDKNGKIKNSKI